MRSNICRKLDSRWLLPIDLLGLIVVPSVLMGLLTMASVDEGFAAFIATLVFIVWAIWLVRRLTWFIAVNLYVRRVLRGVKRDRQ